VVGHPVQAGQAQALHERKARRNGHERLLRLKTGEKPNSDCTPGPPRCGDTPSRAPPVSHASVQTKRPRNREASAPTTMRLLGDPAAVHVPRHAAYLLGGIAAQEHRQCAELLGRDEFAGGLLLHQQLLLGLQDGNAFFLGTRVDLLLHQRRQHPARADRVDGEAGLRGLQRHRLGQADDAVLGGHVSRLLRGRHQPVRRRDVDDAPPVLALHARHREPRGMERRRQVDGDDGVPALGREVFYVGHVLDAGIVDEDVHAAEFGIGVGEHRLDLGRLAHVGAVVADADGVLAGRGDLGLGPVHVAEAVHDDVGTLRRERAGDAQADAAGGAGHQGGFSLQHADLRFTAG